MTYNLYSKLGHFWEWKYMLSEWDTGTIGVNRDWSRKTRTLDHPLLITYFFPDLVPVFWTSSHKFFSFREFICIQSLSSLGSFFLVLVEWKNSFRFFLHPPDCSGLQHWWRWDCNSEISNLQTREGEHLVLIHGHVIFYVGAL